MSYARKLLIELELGMTGIVSEVTECVTFGSARHRIRPEFAH